MTTFNFGEVSDSAWPSIASKVQDVPSHKKQDQTQDAKDASMRASGVVYLLLRL